MAERLYMSGTPPRLITSKPGYNASPSLGDIYKTFDSDWFNGAGIRWQFQGTVTMPSDVVREVYFPYALDHIPKFDFFWWGYSSSASVPVMRNVTWPVAFPGGPSFYGWGGTGDLFADIQNVRCYNDRVHVERRVGGSGVLPFRIIIYQS